MVSSTTAPTAEDYSQPAAREAGPPGRPSTSSYIPSTCLKSMPRRSSTSRHIRLRECIIRWLVSSSHRSRRGLIVGMLRHFNFWTHHPMSSDSVDTITTSKRSAWTQFRMLANVVGTLGCRQAKRTLRCYHVDEHAPAKRQSEKSKHCCCDVGVSFGRRSLDSSSGWVVSVGARYSL